MGRPTLLQNTSARLLVFSYLKYLAHDPPLMGIIIPLKSAFSERPADITIF
jgi:hypothetical protein